MAEERLRRWERRSEMPLLWVALVFLVAFAAPILDPGLSQEWVVFWEGINLLTWAIFAADYAIRVKLAHDRRHFLWTHMIDLAVIILPLLRPLRLLRLLTVMTVLGRRVAQGFRGQVIVNVVGATLLLGFAASLAVLDAERASDKATITSFGDAVWWTITTMTTVGYGDEYPTTVTGRLVAVFLMLGGIALLGTVTATIAAWFVERFQETDEAELETQADIAEVLAEVRALRAEVSRLRAP